MFHNAILLVYQLVEKKRPCFSVEFPIGYTEIIPGISPGFSHTRFAVVQNGQDKKSGFGIMGPTWIHDSLTYTPSQVRNSNMYELTRRVRILMSFLMGVYSAQIWG